MKKIKTISTVLIHLLIFFSCLLPVQAQTIHKNFGFDDDFSYDAEVYFDNSNLTVSEFIYAENPVSGAYFPFLLNKIVVPNVWEYIPAGTLPDSGKGFIRYRSLKNVYVTKLYISSQAFVKDAQNHPTSQLYLQIRYKDTTLDPHFDFEYGPHRYPNKNQGVSILAWDGSDWRKIGETAGRYDFRWKTVTCEIPPEYLKSVLNQFKFKIGDDWYAGSSIYGNWLAIDKLTLSSSLPAEESSQAGYMPQVNAHHNFGNLAATGILENGAPFFPLILHIFPHVRAGIDLLAKAQESKFNTVTYDGWNAHKRPGQGAFSTWYNFT
ncbi:MAG: hypothetical protein ACT6FF_07855, partial [Methanosarcinaceae archaeon]